MRKKWISAVMAAVMLSAMSAVSVTAYAEESAEQAETTAAAEEQGNSEETEETTTATTAPDDERDYYITEIPEAEETTPHANDGNKYYTDDFFDTKGNATLIKEEQVIYESEEMQFIAVTTKSGDVFYILINYSAAKDENNVYFLNKVDTLDLYALLYMTDDEEENGIDLNRVQQAEDAYFNHVSMNTVTDDSGVDSTEETTETTEVAPPKQTNNANMVMLLGVGMVALIAVGFVGFKLLKKKPAAKIAEPEFEDDDEINEDEEI